MTITLGYWLSPALFTVAVIAALTIWEIRQPPAYGYSAIGAGVVSGIIWLIGAVFVVVGWLVYFIIF